MSEEKTNLLTMADKLEETIAPIKAYTVACKNMIEGLDAMEKALTAYKGVIETYVFVLDELPTVNGRLIKYLRNPAINVDAPLQSSEAHDSFNAMAEYPAPDKDYKDTFDALGVATDTCLELFNKLQLTIENGAASAIEFNRVKDAIQKQSIIDSAK